MTEEKLREIKIEQEPTQVTWRRCSQCNAAQMEFQLREEGICQKCYISNLEKENAELLESCRDKDRQLNNWFLSYNEVIKEKEELNRDKTELVNSVTELENKVTELEKENVKLKAQIEQLTCGNSYAVSDDHLNSVPCYTVYECKHCSRRS